MTTIQFNKTLGLDLSALSNRPNSYFELDKKNLCHLLQMALEVELFTIPLYMSGMYSIQGYHQINLGDNFYQGRQWPGMAPKFYSKEGYSTNQDAFNKVFKVFIEEMMHLQIAANLNNAYGNKAKFTENGLVNENYSWTCYAKDKTKIPGIIDFSDLKDNSVYRNVKVNLEALNADQVKLFLAIESSEHDLQEEIKEENKYKYKRQLPFSNEINTDSNLLFGSISGLYTSIISYLLIKYEDGERLFKKAFVEKSIQRDHFNKMGESNKQSEYKNLRTNLFGVTKDEIKFKEILSMIDGILDQGEGLPLYELLVHIIISLVEQNPTDKATIETIIFLLKEMTFDGKNAVDKYLFELQKELNTCTDSTIKSAIEVKLNKLEKLRARLINMNILSSINIAAVHPDNQVNDDALKANHKSYDDVGNQVESASAAARGGENGKMDHHEIFEAVEQLISKPDYMTWDLYHAESTRPWTACDLITDFESYEENRKNYEQLASADKIANAMNVVTHAKGEEAVQWMELLSKATTGTLKGLLKGMEDYWFFENGQFPSPAMAGSGDRMSICWALLGKTPDLTQMPDSKDKDHLRDYHACQGLYMPKNNEQEDCSTNPWVSYGDLGCASPAIYHSCKGTNTCKSEGGCGFVQAYEGGSNCGSSGNDKSKKDPLFVSVPGSNNCATTGGCAVPISALQMFGNPRGEKQQMKYKNECTGEEEILEFKKGDLVYDVAWKVYAERFRQKFPKPEDDDCTKKTEGDDYPKKPEVNVIRLIFPPST